MERVRNQREGVDGGACVAVNTSPKHSLVSNTTEPLIRSIPTISSSKKNDVSIPSNIIILVDLESPMVALGLALENAPEPALRTVPRR